MAEYTRDERLHMSYSFELMTEECSARYIRGTVEALERNMPGGWPCWAISNHDCMRVRSRWATPDALDDAASLFTAMACCIRGSTCVYQGEELGLPEADVPYAALRDPYGIAYWPDSKGRDGCRTPMPWRNQAGGGFTTGRPWLPLDRHHLGLNVERQDKDPASALNRFRQFVQWRKHQPALRWGDIRFLDAPEPLLAFVRTYQDEAILAIFNLGRDNLTLPVPATGARIRTDHGLPSGRIDGGRLQLPGYSVLFAEVGARQSDLDGNDTVTRTRMDA